MDTEENTEPARKKARKNSIGAHYCCVCTNYRGKCVDGKIISLHRFPPIEKLRRIWIQRVKLGMVQGFQITSNSRLCSQHFLGGNGPTDSANIPSIFEHRTYSISFVSF